MICEIAIGTLAPCIGFQFLLPLAPPTPCLLDEGFKKTLSPRTHIVYAIEAFNFASAEAVDSDGQFQVILVFFKFQINRFS